MSTLEKNLILETLIFLSRNMLDIIATRLQIAAKDPALLIPIDRDALYQFTKRVGAQHYTRRSNAPPKYASLIKNLARIQ